MDRGTWRPMVHRVPQSRTRLKWLRTHAGSCCVAQGTLFNVISSLDGEKNLGENGYMCIMAETLYHPHETVTTLLIGYTPIENKVK